MTRTNQNGPETPRSSPTEHGNTVPVTPRESGLYTAAMFLPRAVGHVFRTPQYISDAVIGRTGVVGNIAHTVTNPLVVAGVAGTTLLGIGANQEWFADACGDGHFPGGGTLHAAGETISDAVGSRFTAIGNLYTTHAAPHVDAFTGHIGQGARNFIRYARGGEWTPPVVEPDFSGV